MAPPSGRYFPVVVIQDVTGSDWSIVPITGIPRSGLIHRVSATCSNNASSDGDIRANPGPAGVYTDISLRIAEVESPTGYGDDLVGGRIVLQYALTPTAPERTIDSQESPPIGYLGEAVTGAQASRNGRLWLGVKLGPDVGSDITGVVVVRLEVGDD